MVVELVVRLKLKATLTSSCLVFTRWRRDILRRLDDLEVALGAGSPEDQQPGSFHGLVARVTSLESLSRLTLGRSCHQLYTTGIRQEL